jgi:leucyl aminopeptidase
MEMMMDMSGAAAVCATIMIAEKLQMNKNLIVLIPAVENMPSGTSMKPGDIITMMDGTHVEIGHTDAEGRLILADALTYAASLKPARVIDVATLTGAASVALGERASAIFTDNDEIAQKTVEAAEKIGDYVWRMPLWDEYAAEIAGTHGDIANIRTKGQGGIGGSITAAIFLKHFAKEFKDQWMHIDIAPTMTSVFDEQLVKGAKGSPVRLLVELLS